ncbi:MAG: M14 family zinc carboxypeptidase [Bacteroidales bacterium]|nr:M14 family zinc carboxypeptidase [Bacteroidales bacterium]MDY6075368.1 M14 family zinc carboxypeptidase [Bacteroidales bacterium]
MKKRFLFVILLLVSVCVSAQEKDLDAMMQQRNEYYFSFKLNADDDLSKIARTISVDKVDGDVVVAYANNLNFMEFNKLGHDITLLTPPSLVEEHRMFDGNSRATYEWDSYPTYEAYEEMMFDFAQNHPDKCEIITLGTLSSNRKILVAHINNGVSDGKPKFLYTSTIHGDETTGYIMMLRLIDYLLENQTLPEVQNVLDNIDLFVCPNTNPDGTYHGGNNTVNGATRANAQGIDMNRNFPDMNDGPHPDGNPYATETEWLMDFAQNYQFTMAANYHGGAEVMNYPWDNETDLHVDDAWWQLVSREYADLCHQVNPNYMTFKNNGITNGAQWYMIGGGRQDYMNYYHKCREVTIECSDTKCPSGSQLPNFWNINKNSIFAYMNQCLYGIHGVVTDMNTGAPVSATISISNHDNDYSVVESQMPAGDFHRPIKGGTYNVVVTANGYYPFQQTVTVADGQTVVLNVALEPGEGLIADFNVSSTNVANGGVVNFTDASWGIGINSWSWEFEGAEPSTSSVQNPQGIRYSENGVFGVRLTVTNENGLTDTKYAEGLITVMNSVNMHAGEETTCSSLFYDDGGPNSNYSDNRNYTLTFFPDTEGAKIKVDFLSFNTESNYDYLKIYDGTSTSSAMIGSYTGGNSPGTVVASNAQGALTFNFTSDSYSSEPGWEAVVSCSGLPLEVYAQAESDTLCPGESMHLNAVVSGGNGNFTFDWSPKENLDDFSSMNPVFTAPENGEFTYVVTVSDGEQTNSASVSFFVADCLSTDEQPEMEIGVFPNPSSSTIQIMLDHECQYVEISMFNNLGQMVKAVVNSTDISVEDLASGVYLVRIDVDGKQFFRKIFVE